eukprot:scaffold26384_cov36-Tisochrysis_lutea.AAC.1
MHWSSKGRAKTKTGRVTQTEARYRECSKRDETKRRGRREGGIGWETGRRREQEDRQIRGVLEGEGDKRRRQGGRERERKARRRRESVCSPGHRHATVECDWCDGRIRKDELAVGHARV